MRIERKEKMEKTRKEDVLKYILSNDFITGGYLPEDIANRFITSIGAYSTLLNMVRRVQLKTMDRNRIPKIHFRGPITRGGNEYTYDPKTSRVAPSMLTIDATKFQSRTSVSIDSLLTNIEFEGFEKTFNDLCQAQIVEDIEDVSLHGDRTIVGTDDVSELRKQMDGWGLMSEGAHLLDASGYTIQKDIWASMYLRMPKRYRKKKKAYLKFFISDNIWMDWVLLNSGRSDAIGIASMKGEAISPFGFEIVPVPLFPEDLDVDTDDATAAWVRSSREAYVEIEAAVNDQIRINVDGGGEVQRQIDPGVYIPQELKAELNDKFGVDYFDVDAFGRLIASSTTTGGASSFEFVDCADSALEMIGFDVGVTSGAAAGAGVSHDGSYLWLTDPLNLIYGIFHKMRFHREYNHQLDAIDAVWYFYQGAAIEEMDMMVRCDNVRCRNLF
jgi:hypothetical protein